MMKKRILSFACVLLVVFYATSCLGLAQSQPQEYGSLISAVTFSKSAVQGEFKHNIPADFDAAVFMKVVRDKIPERSYHILEKYRLQVIPKTGYYLLKVYDPRNNSLVLFDYSCTTGVEGRVWEAPAKYDLNHLELYDKCKQRH